MVTSPITFKRVNPGELTRDMNVCNFEACMASPSYEAEVTSNLTGQRFWYVVCGDHAMAWSAEYHSCLYPTGRLTLAHL